MLFFTDTLFTHESSNKFLLNIFTFTKGLILLIITNKSSENTIKTIYISYKLQETNSTAITGSAN